MSARGVDEKVRELVLCIEDADADLQIGAAAEETIRRAMEWEREECRTIVLDAARQVEYGLGDLRSIRLLRHLAMLMFDRHQ